MAKTTFTNTQRGARGVYDKDGALHMIEPGKSLSIEVSAEELRDQKANKFFDIGGKAKADDDDAGGKQEPEGPLDQSIAKLKDHLATVDDVETLNQLGKDEAAGQNRSGALDAIQARIEELKPAE